MKTLHYSIIVIISITVLLVPQTVFGQTYDEMVDALNKNSTKMDKLVHDGAILITTQTLNKTQYNIGERVTVYPELTNIGNKSMDIYYLWDPFFVVVTFQDGSIVWTDGPGLPPMEFSYNRNQTLEPNIPFTTKNPYPDDINSNFRPLVLDKAGNYTISSVGDFYVNDYTSHRVFLWSKPIQITVVPEFPFAIPVFIIGIGSLVIFYRVRFK